MTTPAASPEQDLRYPIGRPERSSALSAEARRAAFDTMAAAPAALRQAVEGLTDEQLDTPYRPGGWTVRQLVHHVADSHMNAYIRFKLALTEDSPTIRPYFEDRWAELADSKLPVDVSLRLINDLHARWVAMLNSMTDEEFG